MSKQTPELPRASALVAAELLGGCRAGAMPPPQLFGPREMFGAAGTGGSGRKERGARKWVPEGVFRPFRGNRAGGRRGGKRAGGLRGSGAPLQPPVVPLPRGARGARSHLLRARDARPPRGGRAEGKHQKKKKEKEKNKTERVWGFVRKHAKENAELKNKIREKPTSWSKTPKGTPPHT